LGRRWSVGKEWFPIAADQDLVRGYIDHGLVRSVCLLDLSLIWANRFDFYFFLGRSRFRTLYLLNLSFLKFIYCL
jgi:hypothetical protein